MTILLFLALLQQIKTLVAKTPAIVGVAAMNVETGKTVHLRGTERFPMGSVFKFPVALAVLQQVDQGKISLSDEATITPDQFSPGWSPLRDGANGKPVTETIGRLLERTLSESDNTAADYLMMRLGGPGVVTRHLRDLGITGIRVDRSEKQMTADLHKPGGVARYATDPRDTATPDAMLALLLKLHKGDIGLSAESREIALRMMADTPTGKRRIKSAIPADAILAHKTGTMPGTVNDAGIITSPDGKSHIVLVVFTKSGTKATEESREDVIAGIARAVYASLH